MRSLLSFGVWRPLILFIHLLTKSFYLFLQGGLPYTVFSTKTSVFDSKHFGIHGLKKVRHWQISTKGLINFMEKRIILSFASKFLIESLSVFFNIFIACSITRSNTTCLCWIYRSYKQYWYNYSYTSGGVHRFTVWYTQSVALHFLFRAFLRAFGDGWSS